MKRIQIDIFVDEVDTITPLLNQLKLKAKDQGEEKSRMTVHDCGHKDGKPCKNVVIL